MYSGSAAIIGYAMLLGASQPGVKYFGVFLSCAGVYGSIPMIIVWISNNTVGSTKQAVAVAIMISFGNIGGICSSFLYPKADGPNFVKGHAVTMGFLVLMVTIAGFAWLYFAAQNRAKARAAEQRGRPLTAEEIEAGREMAEQSPAFRYTL